MSRFTWWAWLLGAVIATTSYCSEPQKTVPDSTALTLSDNAKFVWVQKTSDQFLLTCNGATIGQWYVPNGEYYPWSGGQIQKPTRPPIDPPGRANMTAEQKSWCDSGISGGRLLGKEQLTFSGRIIHPGRLVEAFEGKLQDDSEKGYLVIIAKDAKVREKVLSDWKKLPDDFTSRYLVWQAPPDHFSMQDRFAGKHRFFTEGDPTIVLQAHDGTVLFRRPQANQNYKSTDMQDLLKSDPNYNPKLDPGGPQPAKEFPLSVQSTTALALAGFGVFALLFRRKKS